MAPVVPVGIPTEANSEMYWFLLTALRQSGPQYFACDHELENAFPHTKHSLSLVLSINATIALFWDLASAYESRRVLAEHSPVAFTEHRPSTGASFHPINPDASAVLLAGDDANAELFGDAEGVTVEMPLVFADERLARLHLRHDLREIPHLAMVRWRKRNIFECVGHAVL